MIIWSIFHGSLKKEKIYFLWKRADSGVPGTLKNLDTIMAEQRTSLVAQTVERLSTMWETWVRSLGQEDPLEKEMATHSSTVAWKISWTEERCRLQSMGSQRVGRD